MADDGNINKPELKAWEPPWYDRVRNWLADIYGGENATPQQTDFIGKFTGPENPFNLPAQITHGADTAREGYHQNDPAMMGRGTLEAMLALLPVAYGKAMGRTVDAGIARNLEHRLPRDPLNGNPIDPGITGGNAGMHTPGGSMYLSQWAQAGRGFNSAEWPRYSMAPMDMEPYIPTYETAKSVRLPSNVNAPHPPELGRFDHAKPEPNNPVLTSAELDALLKRGGVRTGEALGDRFDPVFIGARTGKYYRGPETPANDHPPGPYDPSYNRSLMLQRRAEEDAWIDSLLRPKNDDPKK